MNLKKILAVVLSMTLLVSCLVSGMSLNTSAATPDQETAKTQLTEAWNKLYYKPVVAFEGFYTKTSSSWNCETSNNTLTIDELSVPFFSFSNTGVDTTTHLISFSDGNYKNGDQSFYPLKNGAKFSFYVKNDDTTPIKVQVVAKGNANKFLNTVATTASENLVKHTLTVDATEFWDNLRDLPLMRIAIDTNVYVGTDAISAVVYEEKLVAPESNTLLELVKAADKLDLEQIQDDQAKNDFVTALAKAKTVYYSVEANAKKAIIEAWEKVKHKREIIFDTFTYKDESGAWKVINGDIDNVKVENKTVNEEAVTVVENVGKLSASEKPGFMLINNSYANKNDDGTIDVSKPLNKSAMFDIYDYEEAYLYYFTNKSISINLASTQLNTGFSGDTRGEVYVTLNEISENGDYKKLDLFAKFNAIEDNAQHPSYGTTATLDRNIKGEKEKEAQKDSALSRAHIGSGYTILYGISYLYGVKKVKFSEEFGDVFKEVPLEDTIEGTLAYAKGLKYEANGDKTLADWMEAYTKYEAALKNNYNAAELVAVVEDVKAANPAVRISGDAIWSENNLCFYDNGNSTLATAYRTYAQYTCPIEKGQPVLDKVVVDGQSYNLVSRSILIARSDDNNFGTLDMNTVAAKKYFTTTGKDLTQKYWSVKENEDGTTATVTYSMLLTGVSKANAEGKYHMTRAMIEYKDGAGNTVQVYSKPRKHGTIKDTFNYAHGNNNNLQWFPQVNN